MAATRLAAGIIGAGGIAGSHFKALSARDDVRVTAISDVDSQRLAQRAAEWGATPYGDYRELVRAVDLVFVCTPPFAHREPVEAAAAAGKAIYCEKPMALTLDDARAMHAAVTRAGVTLMIGFNFHFEPVHRLLKQTLDSGALGEFVYAWIQTSGYFPSSGWEQRRAQGHWRMTPAQSGGRLFEQIHIVNWLHWVGGEPVSVFGRAATVADDLAVDDLDLAVVTFRQGFGRIELAMTPVTLPERSMGVTGTRGGIVATGASVRLKRKDEPETAVDVRRDVPSRHDHFLDCVRTGRQPENDAADGLRSLAVTLAFQRSAAEGRVVPLAEMA